MVVNESHFLMFLQHLSLILSSVEIELDQPNESGWTGSGQFNWSSTLDETVH